MSKIFRLHSEHGQSIWLDYIDRKLLLHGGLNALIAEGIRGVTSNPTIFYKAIAESTDYNAAIRDQLRIEPTINSETLYERLAVQDVQMAADILQPVYGGSDGADGFVSLEVSPHLAYDTDATLTAARRLWQAVQRPNLMIKVPATVNGLRAFEQLITEGINVNMTLLFSLDRYKAVTDAWLRALSKTPQPDKVASVASFFVSRVDTKVDLALDRIGTPDAMALKGKIAIANAKMVYQHFKKLANKTASFHEKSGGKTPQQRPLWASTGTKNPMYSDVLYVEQLIGRDTVNTLPLETLHAFQVHGELRDTLDIDVDLAIQDLEKLQRMGVDLSQITQELEQEGVKKFTDSYDQLLSALKAKTHSVSKRMAS